MKAPFFFICLLSTFLFLPAQAQENWVIQYRGQNIFHYQNHQLSDSSGQILFSTKVNLIFSGASNRNEDILYLVSSKDILSRETGNVYSSDMREVFYTMKKGHFYLGDQFDKTRLLFTLKGNSRFILGVFDGQTDSFLVKISGKEWSNTGLISGLIALNQYFGMDEKVLAAKPDIRDYADEGNIIGSIRPAWHDDYQAEWSWDGHVLKPAWGNRPEDEWTFDGKSLRPYWDYNINQEWKWDGHFLKPAWNQNTDLIFEWDGQLLRPYWEFRMEDEWIIENGRARAKWSADSNREWIIEGDMPIPVIALIILGFADR